MGFQQRLAHLPSSLLVGQSNLLSRHLAEQGFNTWHTLTSMWKASWIYLVENPTTIQQHHKSHKLIPRRFFLTKEWCVFHLSRKKLDFIHLKDVLKYKCKLYLKQPLGPPQCEIITAYHTTNHRIASEIGKGSSIPISRNNRSCHFCSYDAVEKEAHFG